MIRTVAYTERSDPNKLLGRPHGYISKVNWVDGRVKSPGGDMDVSDGGSVEVFSSPTDAKSRYRYIGALASSSPLFAEYDYLEGSILLRVSNDLVPSQARAYDAALRAVGAGSGPSQSNCAAWPKTGRGTKVAKPADARASAFVGGNTSPRLPTGKAGMIAVVAQGQYDIALPVIIRNNTSQSVATPKVTGAALSSGALIATGADQGFAPDVLKPGEIALGYVYFGGKRLPRGTTFSLKASATPLARSEFDNHRNLAIAESRVSGRSVLGYLKNTSTRPITGPISLVVECFSQAGVLTAEASSFTDQDTAAPGERVPFSVDLVAGMRCPRFLIAANGWAEG